MARTALGVGILIVLFLFGLFSWLAMDRVHMPIAALLQKAAEQSPAEGLATAKAAKALWKKHWRFSAALADHAPMDEIDGLFAQLDAYREAELWGDFSACCLRISRLVEAMAEAHSLSWWNLL